MTVMIVTDAWLPQVNGVVRTLDHHAPRAGGHGPRGRLVAPDLIPHPALPDLSRDPPGAAAPATRRSSASTTSRPTPSTSPPKARSAWRRGATADPQQAALHHRLPHRVSPNTSRRAPAFRCRWTYRFLRWFHAPPKRRDGADAVAVKSELEAHGFDERRRLWSRGVDIDLFRAQDSHRLASCRSRSSSTSAAWRWRRTSRPSSSSTCPAPRWWSATARRWPACAPASRRPFPRRHEAARNWPRSTPPPTCSCSPAGPTPSAW